ncbi:thiamine pyrophosphate-dependent enzyme [Nocardia goodfellowii]|uniref:2-oxoisovalerate dehydrogenase E1 component n=1 Tax=Nocardia goodfellowii TaxID=882446 RepID=A0ABS4QGQ8_9NOCA|nr:thiamine pyrophosphate-dependent enzyme [Nocardia goodfellowii]MBP2190768.1 2-oxoisovalerate dehydrogenase E1 component [Nocardia goodfellowii]
MTEQRVDLDGRFRAAISALTPTEAGPDDTGGFTGGELLELFESQAASRHLDLAARKLGAQRRGYYSIGSSGHEGNAAVAAALRVTDPALLHYRSGAFFVQRCRGLPGSDPIRDVLLGVVAAEADPISGGRHKVFGSKAANIIPQTSTIASHLPRAVGLAFALERAARLGISTEWPADSVVLCSFGDASANHSTAVGAINTAIHTAHQGVPMPILFVCEDNGIGISVPTPPDWIEQAYGVRLGLQYFYADGCDLIDTLTTASLAAQWVRQHRKPAFLRLRTVRLLGHAGSDVESAYRRPADIAADLDRDPVLATGRMLVAAGVATPEQVLTRYDEIARRVADMAESVPEEPKLTSAAAVTAPLAPTHPDEVRADVLRSSETHAHQVQHAANADPGTSSAQSPDPDNSGTQPAAPAEPANFSTQPTEPSQLATSTAQHADSAETDTSTAQPDPDAPDVRGEQPPTGSHARLTGPAADQRRSGGGGSGGDNRMTLAQAINRTLADLLQRDPDVLVFGEDVGRKGGVYGVTKGLQKQFGARRVFDTLLDEQSVLGTALGAGLAGFVPIPEIQYLAYLHNAEDQLRGEAATLSFFSHGRYRNPMVVRIAGLAYQKGFGGHFHNDNSLAVLRDIPGLVLAVPARADDAAAMLRTCVSAARVDGRVCVFLEPIALYHARDVHIGDDAWPAAIDGEHVEFGSARVYGDGTDITLVTFGNGVPMCLRVAHRLHEHGHSVRIVDLRWLAPLPLDDLLEHARATGRVLVVDETRRSGGVSEAICSALIDADFEGRIARVTSADSFIPLGPAAATVLLDEAAIETAAGKLLTD